MVLAHLMYYRPVAMSSYRIYDVLNVLKLITSRMIACVQS